MRSDSVRVRGARETRTEGTAESDVRSVTGACTIAAETLDTGRGGVDPPRSAAQSGSATQSRKPLPAQMLTALRSTWRCTLSGYARQSGVLRPRTHPL